MRLSASERVSPLLLFGIGNPSRGDDAVGPELCARAEERLRSEIDGGVVEILTDFQLQIEHALDLVGRRCVIFVDASVSCAQLYSQRRIIPETGVGPLSHVMSPAAVLGTYARLYGEGPEAWELGITASEFELGAPIAARAMTGVEAALAQVVRRVRTGAW